MTTTRYEPHYTITKDALQLSKPNNSFIARLIAHPLIANDKIASTSKETSLRQLTSDLAIESQLNHIPFAESLQAAEHTPALDAKIESIIKNLFPSQAGNLLTYPCQQLKEYVSDTLFDTVNVKLTAPSTNTFVDIYDHEGNVYVKAINTGYQLNEKKYGNYRTEALFRVTRQGYEFIEYRTDSLAVYDIVMGSTPTDTDWYNKRDRNQWSWLERNVSLFEPIFPDSHFTSFSQRMHNAYENVFNEKNLYRSHFAAFMGWESERRYHENRILNSFLKTAAYLLSFGVFKPLINTTKLFVEFLPAFFSEIGNWILDKSKQVFNQPEQLTWYQKTMAWGGAAVGTLIYGVSNLVRQAGQRLTSPVRSAKEAYEFGTQIHPAVGGTLAAASIFVSTAFMSAAALYIGLEIAIASTSSYLGRLALAFSLTFVNVLATPILAIGIGANAGHTIHSDNLKKVNRKQNTEMLKNSLNTYVMTEQLRSASVRVTARGDSKHIDAALRTAHAAQSTMRAQVSPSSLPSTAMPIAGNVTHDTSSRSQPARLSISPSIFMNQIRPDVISTEPLDTPVVRRSSNMAHQ